MAGGRTVDKLHGERLHQMLLVRKSMRRAAPAGRYNMLRRLPCSGDT
jgi:hypothetical protein